MAVTAIDNGVTNTTVFKRNPGTFTAIAVQDTETVRSNTLEADTISEMTATSGVTIDGVLLKDSQVTTDTILEKTAAAGVTIDGTLLKDGVVQGLTLVAAAAADGAVTVDGKSRTIFITKAGVCALTLADPTATTHDGFKLTFVATTANAHTVSNAAGSGFFSSGGAAKDVATFSGAIGDGFCVIAYQGKWYVDPRGMTGITLG